MHNIEHYKFKAETLRILSVALLTPLASFIYRVVMTGFSFDVSIWVTVKVIVVLVMTILGIQNLLIALNILEQCDHRGERNEHN